VLEVDRSRQAERSVVDSMWEVAGKERVGTAGHVLPVPESVKAASPFGLDVRDVGNGDTSFPLQQSLGH